MLMYPHIDRVAFHIFSWPVYWYGIMYLVGFMGAWGALSLRIRHSDRGFNQDQIGDIIFYGAMGAVIGGRVGYMLFYAWPDLVANPLLLFQTRLGGMSFHGGAIGVVVALLLCARKMGKSTLVLLDFITPAVPIGLGAGRIGNFINGELWGRVSDQPWAMIFPHVDAYPRHPSQLYEFGLEGVLLFTILWTFSRQSRPLGAVSGLFAICYGLFRTFAELFREPDQQIGYISGWLTEGQLLSVPLILVGVALMAYAYTRRSSDEVCT